VRRAVVTVDLLLVFGLGLSASGCHLCSAEQNTPLYDDENSEFLYDGILYTYRVNDFTCPSGKSEDRSIFEALYAKGNLASLWVRVDTS
jgi:hypothetical protein